MDADYSLHAPGSEPLKVTKELYEAIFGFLKSPERPNGNVTIHFACGGIAAVEALIRKQYK
jgi:hypothetical protein